MRMFEELHTEKSGKVFHDGSHKVWSAKFTPETPFRFDDGTRFYMSPIEVAPWDEWPTDPDASPDMPEGWEADHPEE
jgi:hypothetical protein